MQCLIRCGHHGAPMMGSRLESEPYIGIERSADASSQVQTMWTGSALFTRWNVYGPWSVGLRPELYWDPNGAEA